MHPPVRRAAALAVSLAAALTAAAPAGAYNIVPSSNGESWGVQDAAAPRVDTGSVRDTTSNALRGFGGIRVRVSTGDLRNGELVRGFGLRFDPPERFTSTRSVDLGGVAIARSIRFNRTANWGRWLDAFHNTTDAPIAVDVAFGGQTGIGNASGSTNAPVVETSSGDAAVTPEDSWALSRVSTAPLAQGPSAVVFGSPDPFAGALARMANFLRDPFGAAPAASGHEANFVGYQHSFTLQPGETKTLAHFVVIGTSENASTAGTQVTAVRGAAATLAATPSLADLTKAELCALENWDLTAAAVPAFDPASCGATPPAVKLPPAAEEAPRTTGSPYDVVGKTIGQLQADMEAGKTTSEQITRAYLDRIAAYDVGPWGFNSYTTVADDALDQAKAADAARAAGAKGALLGIPLAVKDLLDTKDMPTTNGSLVFEGFRSAKDATQVALLREAGAIILGKASLEEYALSGHYSDSAYGQVWNAFSPSKSSIASSGGPAVATALSLAAGSLGSQTGDSLYGPASAASLYTLRGTDGVQSLTGAMPLTWLQDYVGGLTRSLPDLADLLNATAKTDPADPLSKATDPSKRFAGDWHDALDAGALRGKRIAYYDTAFVDPFGTTDTVGAQKAALRYFEDAGATLVRIDAPPNGFFPSWTTGDRAFTGWKVWIDQHPESPYQDPREILGSPKRLPYRRLANGYTGAGAMTDAQQQAYIDWRLTTAKQAIDSWLDNPPNPVDADTGVPSPGPVDAVAFPGLRSVVSLNDGGSNAFGRGDPPTNGLGGPSVAFPAGVNGFGEPTNLQLSGRAYSDKDLLGYAYAFDAVAKQHIEPATAPALAYVKDAEPPVVEQSAPVAPAPAPLPAPAVPAPAPAGKPALRSGSVAAARVRLATARSRGLAVKVSTSEAAVLRAELRLSAAAARKLGVPRVIGSVRRTFTRAGSATLRVKLTARAARALARSRGAVSATLVTSAATPDGRRSSRTRKVVLTR
ncbi:MAG TPA: amidase [Solirubrobacteraceae bacterium]|nr:amidase [Solirubrobacteraceae bacterium]